MRLRKERHDDVDDRNVARLDGVRHRTRRRVLTVLAVLVLVVGGLVWATSRNTFGQNIHGTVYCGSKADVAGVFIQADRLPRAWPNGPEIQSGFAHWEKKLNSSPGVADFDYWLPLGGLYSIQFGCGRLKNGKWASNNQTPFVAGTGQEWWCLDPNPIPLGTETLVGTTCRSN